MTALPPMSMPRRFVYRLVAWEAGVLGALAVFGWPIPHGVGGGFFMLALSLLLWLVAEFSPPERVA